MSTGRPTTAMGADDIAAFADQESDFAFEMQVLSVIRKHGLICQHGGTYHDPKSEKIRQFDIRAQQRRGYLRTLWAIECKNVRDTSPILAHVVQRERNDAFNDVILGKTVEVQSQQHAELIFESPAGEKGRVARLKDAATLYQQREWVAKSVDQIVRDGQGKLKGNDEQFFNKSSQALTSAYDLIQESLQSAQDGAVYYVLPVLVVPDQRLWAIEYSESGARQKPKPVQRFQSYTNLEWGVKTEREIPATFTISHLEVVEISSLPELLNQFSDFYLNMLWQYALSSPGRS